MPIPIPEQLLRHLAGTAAAVVALIAPPAFAADKADCDNPPHPILNWCAGATAYSSALSIAEVRDSGDTFTSMSSRSFVAKLENKLRARGDIAGFAEEGVTITDPKILAAPDRVGKPNYYRTVAVIPPKSARDQSLHVCFEGGADKASRQVIAIYTITTKGEVIKDDAKTREAAAAGASACTNFALATRDALNQQMASQPSR